MHIISVQSKYNFVARALINLKAKKRINEIRRLSAIAIFPIRFLKYKIEPMPDKEVSVGIINLLKIPLDLSGDFGIMAEDVFNLSFNSFCLTVSVLAESIKICWLYSPV